jgi:hypothetical protein
LIERQQYLNTPLLTNNTHIRFVISSGPHGFACDAEGRVIQALVRITVSSSGTLDAKDINVTTKLPPMIVPSENAFKIDPIQPGWPRTPQTFEIVLRTMPRLVMQPNVHHLDSVRV